MVKTTAFFCFYGTLNDFLPVDKRQVNFAYALKDRASVKDTIEAIGVPHPEVDLILVNGKSVDFSYSIQADDHIQVYPVSTEETLPSFVRPRPLEHICFVLDVHLGKLATSLRLLGFDTLYRNDYDDEELAEISSRENRILLTQDRGLLKRSIVTYGYFVRASNPQQQVIEVLNRFNLFAAISQHTSFSRCLRCNGVLEPVAKEVIRDRVPVLTQQYYDEFSCCQTCGQIYWKGGHYDRMKVFVDQILQCKEKR